MGARISRADFDSMLKQAKHMDHLRQAPLIGNRSLRQKRTIEMRSAKETIYIRTFLEQHKK